MDPLFSIKTADVAGQVGMTLAAIAYSPNLGAINTLLKNPNLATQGRWTATWYGFDDANQAFVAIDNQSGQYAIAIRGSVTDPMTPAFWIDWLDQDLSVFRPAAWPYGGAPSGATISQGSLHGLSSLLSLSDINGQSIVDYFRSIAAPKWLTAVVGHSLGGALASVLAPYLHQEFSPGQNALDFWPVTFAAPTAGNAAFAGWIEQQLAAGVGRYHNTLDVVPHAWAGLQWIADSYLGGPKLPSPLKDLVEKIRQFLKLVQADYRQPGAGIPLTGSLVATPSWFTEAGTQHAGATYLKLLGAPPIPSEFVSTPQFA